MVFSVMVSGSSARIASAMVMVGASAGGGFSIRSPTPPTIRLAMRSGWLSAGLQREP